MINTSPLGDVPIALTVRGGIIDCVHYGSAVMVDSEGAIIWKIGNPERLVFERSTTKPFRALTVIRGGTVDAFELAEADIALMAGSHSGTTLHVDRCQQILKKCGLQQEALCCGIRLPLGEDALFELGQSITAIGPLHNDCSGEHTGVLALCQHRNYNISDYLDLSHPVQQLFRRTMEEFSDNTIIDQINVPDRCGMPNSPVPLSTLARRIIRLIKARDNDESVMRLFEAIINNPFVYTGKGRLIGELISRSKRNVIGKCGAEGVYTIGWLKSRVAFAIKVADGNHRAALPALQQAARSTGEVLPVLSDCVDQDAFAKVTIAAYPVE